MKLFNRVKNKLFKEYNTKIEILKLLSTREMYGYEVWGTLSKKKEITTQTVYSHLKDLKIERLVISQKKGKKEYYKITSRGRKILEKGFTKKKPKKKERYVEEETEGMICDGCGEEIPKYITPLITEEGKFHNSSCLLMFRLYGEREDRVVNLDKIWERKRRK